MIRWLLRCAEWLDKRFPPKVVVTQKDYEAFTDRGQRHESALGAMRLSMDELRTEVTGVKASLAAIKEALAKGGAAVLKPEAEKLRDEFVRGEFNRGPGRAAVEANG